MTSRPNVTRMTNPTPKQLTMSVDRTPPSIDRAANANKASARIAQEAKWKAQDLIRTRALQTAAADAKAAALARGLGRFAGPLGELIGMTTPTGDARDDRPTGPLMGGNKSTGPSRGPTSEPARTEPSRGPASSGPDRGPTSAPSRTEPSRASSGPSAGPTSAPSRTEPSSGSLSGGGPRGFAKGGLIKKRGWGEARTFKK